MVNLVKKIKFRNKYNNKNRIHIGPHSFFSIKIAKRNKDIFAVLLNIDNNEHIVWFELW